MKKKVLFTTVAVIMLMLLTTTALARGHGGSKLTGNAVCTTVSCTQTGLHEHNGKTYAAHSYYDGHIYHDYCTLKNCTVSGYHEHDGYYCFGHTANDGHRDHKSGKRHH